MSVRTGWFDLGTTLRGIPVAHQARAGDRPVLMVHGIGPGTTGFVNFAPIISRLSPRVAPHVIDLAGFGASGRLTRPPFFDVSFWLDQIDLAIARILDRHGRLPLLVGNSVGGALVLKIAARRRDLPRVIAIGAPASADPTPELRAFWTAPRTEAALAAALQPMTGAAMAPDSEIVRERLALFLTGDHGAYFAAMLDNPEACLAAVLLSEAELDRIETPVTLLHGDMDRACLLTATLALRARLPHADLTVFGGAGHQLMSERTADIAALIEFLIEKV